MSDHEILDYSSFLVIVEDILETFPIKDLEGLFDKIESNLKSKSYSSFNDNRKLTMLKISNTLLKRLSSSMDTKLRGRVQMALASIFPISDKSGVNQKGLYNMNNIMGKLNTQGDYETKISNLKFYKQFWVVLKHISNPLSVKIRILKKLLVVSR
jgi:THO complex subunit 1